MADAVEYRVTFTPGLADAQAAYALFHRPRRLPVAIGAAVCALVGGVGGLTMDVPNPALALPMLAGVLVYFLWLGLNCA